jgi:hypothetical protein
LPGRERQLTRRWRVRAKAGENISHAKTSRRQEKVATPTPTLPPLRGREFKEVMVAARSRVALGNEKEKSSKGRQGGQGGTLMSGPKAQEELLRAAIVGDGPRGRMLLTQRRRREARRFPALHSSTLLSSNTRKSGGSDLLPEFRVLEKLSLRVKNHT